MYVCMRLRMNSWYVCGPQEQAALKKQLEKALAGAEESHLSVKSNKEVAAAFT